MFSSAGFSRRGTSVPHTKRRTEVRRRLKPALHKAGMHVGAEESVGVGVKESVGWHVGAEGMGAVNDF